jgi:hypothetical protein
MCAIKITVADEIQNSSIFTFRIPMHPSRRFIAMAGATFFLLTAAYPPSKVGLPRFIAGLTTHTALLLLYIFFAALISFLARLAFPIRSAQPELQFGAKAVCFVPSKLSRLVTSEAPAQVDIPPLSKEILLRQSFVEGFPDGCYAIVRAQDGAERQLRVGNSMPLDAQESRRLINGITTATSLPVRLIVRQTSADGGVQESPWTPASGKAKGCKSRAALAICLALLPYFGGLLVIVTRDVGWLALAGAAICALCTCGAYFAGKRRNPALAKLRLMVDPILYSCEFLVTAVVIRYVFMR